MDPKMSVEAALQQLESYHTELVDISDGKLKMDQFLLMVRFLGGLPQKFDSIKWSIMGGDMSRS
jgi:hypothetical protein